MSSFLGGSSRDPSPLAQLVNAGGMILAPGCYDPLGARLIEDAGFEAVYMTGFGTAAGRMGRPDVGLLTLSEMVDNARRIAAAVSVPVIADADTGYGNPLNVIRTVHEFEAAGVAAIHLEDQAAPKKCGHLEGKQLIGAEEMAAKVAAAVAARERQEFLIIARTDARAVEGLDAALERGRRYRDAGADMLFVEAPQSTDEIERIAEYFHGVPLLFNYTEGGRTPAVTHAYLRELGYRVVIFPLSTLLSATTAMRATLAEIRARGTPLELLPDMMDFDAFLDFIGIGEIRDLEQRFAGQDNPHDQ